MRRLLFAVVIGLTPAWALGQGVSPNLAKGSEAMLFTFDGFSTLRAGDFEGGIGGKYFIGSKTALRLGLEFARASEDVPANPPAGVSGTDGEQSATRFGVSAALEYHFRMRRVTPYFGGGIGFANTSTKRTTAEVGSPPPAQDKTENEQNGENINGVTFLGGNQFDIFGLAGVEFFLFNEVSLGAEYRLGFFSSSRADEKVSSGNLTTTTKVGGSTGFGISNSGLLTLAVYF